MNSLSLNTIPVKTLSLEALLRKIIPRHSGFIIWVLLLIILPAGSLSAHCDGIDGPVVTAARKALENNNINLVLIWVEEKDESLIRDAFQKTMNVRKLSPQARELADDYFFETLVRIHRKGEGEDYTGLKPAGRDLGPVIPAVDKAVATGSFDTLKEVFDRKKLETGKLEDLFRELMNKKNYKTDDLHAGRSYVHSYIKLMHLAEEHFTRHNSKAHGH